MKERVQPEASGGVQAGRDRSRLNMASRMDKAMGGDEERERTREEEDKRESTKSKQVDRRAGSTGM